MGNIIGIKNSNSVKNANLEDLFVYVDTLDTISKANLRATGQEDYKYLKDQIFGLKEKYPCLGNKMLAYLTDSVLFDIVANQHINRR